VKFTKLSDRFTLKYSFHIFNVTNTPSFDIPIDDVTQNEDFNGIPVTGSPVSPTGCETAHPVDNFYNCPQGLRSVNKTIGSQRQMHMSLKRTLRP
jgi:hypothetical protein